MTLSRTAKESLKTALAMVIAYAIALTMDWDKPYWAGYAVAFVSLSSIGQSLNKAALRMAGTLLAVPMAFLLLGLFPQERWLFMLFLSLWVGFCTYMAGGEQRQYFWICAGFICAIIAIDAGPSGENAFAIAVLRSQETGLGILVYGLVASLLWPVRSGARFNASVKQFMAAQQAFYHACRDRLLGRTSAAAVQEKIDQLLQAQAQFKQLLSAAAADTYEVWELREKWDAFQQQATALTASLGLWRGSLKSLGEIDMPSVLPDLADADAKLEQRFAAIEAMMENQAPVDAVAPIKLTIDRDGMRSLTAFQCAELAAAKARWQALETQTRGMCQTVADLQGFGAASDPVAPADTGPGAFVLDTERFCAAIRVMAGLWVAYLAWIYVPDLPGGSGAVMATVPLGMNLAQLPQVRVIKILRPALLSVLAAGIIYIFIMPQLSTFLELGLLLFLFTFGVTYLFSAPDQALGKAFGLALFLSIASVSNDQTYSFLVVSTNALLMSIVCLALIVAEYIPVSPLPEKNFQRLLGRYFRSSEYLLASMAIENPGAASRRARALHARHLYEIMTLPKKLHVWVRVLPPDLLPGGAPTTIKHLVGDLELLSLRLRELLQAGGQTFSPALVSALRADFITWRQEILKILGHLSEDPGAIDPDSFRAGLDQAMEHMEASIREAMDRPDRVRLNEQEGVRFLQLLAAYRGVAEALARYSGSATTVDWPRWREARFA
jgi:uncharacterized membrane protein YccC